MSQTVTPGPPPLPAPPSAGHPVAPVPPSGSVNTTEAHVNWVVQAVRSAFAGTPGTLRLVSLGVIFGCLIAGFGGAAALRERHSALGEARSTTAHLVLLQSVRTNLLRADAAITNSFLNGGLEPPEQLATYSTSLDAAANDLALAARASEQDAEALGAANTALGKYSGLVQTARANNRQGLPVGINYLSVASTTLQNDVLGPIETRTTADQKSVDRDLDRGQNARWWLALAVIAGIGLLIWSQFLLARVTHRFVNLPAAGATVVLIVVLAASLFVMASVQRTASDVRDGSYADTVQLAEARVGAFTAKRIEAFELIKQGSGTDKNEGAWDAAMKKASALPAGTGDAGTSIKEYGQAHQSIHSADVKDGDYEAAVDLATSVESGSSNAYFTAYDEATATALDQDAQDASGRLGQNGWLLVLFGILLALAGVVAAIVAWFGVSLRLGEYR